MARPSDAYLRLRDLEGPLSEHGKARAHSNKRQHGVLKLQARKERGGEKALQKTGHAAFPRCGESALTARSGKSSAI